MVLSATWLNLACQSEPPPPLTLQLGPQTVLSTVPKTALARYTEHPTAPDELRLLFASDERSCSELSDLKPGDILITVTLRVPSGETIEAGVFPWHGDLAAFAEAETPTALPFVRLAEEGRALPAGGELRLDTIEKREHGQVIGELRFQDGSPGESATTGLTGPFRARMCELALDESRRKKED